MPARRNALPLWVRAADIAVVALLLSALFVWYEGGFAVQLGGVRLSVRSAWRLMLWASILFCLRHVLIRDAPLHRRLTVGVARLRALVPAGDELELEPWLAGPDRRDLASPRLARGAIWWRGAGVIAVFIALTAFMTYPQARFLASGVSVNEGDALFSTWRLAWVAHQLPRDPLHLFDANIFYPERGTLAFSDAMLVPALTAAPLFWLGVPQLAVHNIVFLSGFALSGAGMFLLVRSLTGSSGAALLAGFAFAFLPFRYVHYAHLELQMAQWMPLGLWAFHRTLRSGRLPDGLLTGLFLALQCLSSWYYGIFFATFLAPVALATLIGQGMARARSSIRALSAGAALTAILVVPMAMPYLAARQHVGERPESESASTAPCLVITCSRIDRTSCSARRRGARASRSGSSSWASSSRSSPSSDSGRRCPPRASGTRMGLALALDISLGYNGTVYPWLHEYILRTGDCACRRGWRWSWGSGWPSWPATAARGYSGCSGAVWGVLRSSLFSSLASSSNTTRSRD